ncbi:transglycosylase SLT domain-containing protein [Pseudoduganella lutea]|uniref:Lytic transglycosylase n=1 Tax=Pseudoduganella lutea TaxID=321985 RepID=A0A4P6L5U4_9BURK|nr:transglycosylase SLT domain-containing protein [Pseudoduganella lutea]QBE66834.1 lytic transglycosylase [Pseudoduganella lutea]
MPTIDLNEARKITSEKEAQYGIPSGTLFKIGGIESSFNKNAVSPKGARSYFQFMPSTAQAYNVTYGDFPSEADGAARYIKDNLAKYGGSLELALADYNGGPKAASALARGKPWAETSDYLAKFYKGAKPATEVPISTQFSTGTETPLTASPGASELYRDSEQQQSEYGGFVNGVGNLPGAISRGFQVDNSVYNWWQDRGVKETDPDFRWNDERTSNYLDGVPEQHWGYILQATSDREAAHRKARMADSLQKEAELGRMGVAGFGGRLIGGLADLPTLIAFVPGMGGEGLLTVGSRVANAARLGLFNAGANVAFDAAAGRYRPTYTHDQLYMSAAMGLGLGAVIGGAINPARIGATRLARENQELAQLGRREASVSQKQELVDLVGEKNIDHVKADAHLGTRSDAVNVDERVAAGNAVDEVDEITARVREEVKSDIPVYERTNLMRRRIEGLGDDTVKSRLSSLKGSDDTLIAGLAARLEGQIGDDIRIVTRREDFRSYYDAGRHEIHLSKGAEDWVALHEIAHAATVNKIRFGLDNPTSAHGHLTKELHGVYEEVRKAAAGRTFSDYKTDYYLKNIDEFVAGMYSGKSEFVEFLAKTQVSGQTLLSKAVDIVRRILGMAPGEHNALTKAMGLTDELISTPLQMKQTLVHKRTGAQEKVDYLMTPANSGVDAATAAAATRAEIPTVFGWGLGLENRLGGEKAPEAVRELASKLFGTTIGYKGHSVVKANAWDDTTKWADSWAVEMRKGTYPVFEEWFKKQDLPYHQKGQAFEDFGTQVSNYIRGFEDDFSPEVIKAGDHMRKTLDKVREYINNPLRDEGMQKRGLTETELRDPETNEVALVGKLEKNPNYLPRKHDVNKWNDMATSFGREAVEGWWARAYQSGREGISDEAAAKWSKWYVRTVEEAHANRSQDLLEDMMRGTDKDGLKESLMRNGMFSDWEAQKIMDDMFPPPGSDAGRIASLKHRNTINETYTESWTRADGEKVQVSLNDFTHSNAFDLVEPYLRRTAGSVALAKHLDIYKSTHIQDRILDATTNKLGSGFKQPADLEKFRTDLQFAFDRLQGLPQEQFSTLNKSMEMWRNFNVIRLMGGAVWNQATEMSQIVGSMGWRTTMGAIPELRSLTRDIASGKAPNDILDHLENTIGGVGSEYVARMEFTAKDDWVRHKGDTAFNRRLDQLDTAQRKLARGVLDYTGMTPIMIQQKRVHAVALVNHWVSAAKGTESKFLTPERLAWMGLDQQDYRSVLKAIDTYTKPAQGEFSKSHKMDFEGWQKADPKTYSQFMTAIHRESRRVVQENDLGSMIPLMGTTLGKTVFQFMNFSLHGWNKSLQFAMNHRDWSTLSTVLHGSLFASLAYMGRTMLTSQGMDPQKQQEFLAQRMAPGQIVANSFGRIAQASLLPVAFDTVSPYPLFSGMRTTSDLSSFASNPTYQAINGLISMKKLVRNGVSDEYQTTEKDIRTWGRLLPLNNVVPVSTMLNSLANDYPSSEAER